MKKSDEISDIKGDISAINHLIRVLNSHTIRLEEAYKRKDSLEFNALKKEILQLQKKIHEILGN